MKQKVITIESKTKPIHKKNMLIKVSYFLPNWSTQPFEKFTAVNKFESRGLIKIVGGHASKCQRRDSPECGRSRGSR